MIDGINGKGMLPGPWLARSLPARADGMEEPARLVRSQTPQSRPAGIVSRALVAELAAAPPVDRVRVVQLQADIAGGRFRIDADAIAAAMLRLDRGRP